MSTKTSRVHLAVHQTSSRPDPRMAVRRLRVAFASVLTKTPTPRHAWDDVTRRDPRAVLPCEKERAMLHQAIHQGCTTPELVIQYRLAQLHDDLAQFTEAPLLEELFYRELMREQMEAFDAQAHAHAVPTTSLELAAIRETEEASVMMRVYCWLKRHGGQIRHGVH